MINQINAQNKKINIKKIVEVLFYTFPLSFIIGNLILSLHLLIFIGFSFYLIKKESLTVRFKKLYWLLILFFLYLFFVTLFQFQSQGIFNAKLESLSLEENPIFKSFILVQFLILIFIIDTLFLNRILELKKLFLFISICTFFVALDVVFQYLVGFDLFGFKSLGYRNSGPFNDELISGAYLQKFSLFTFYYIFVKYNESKNLNVSLIFLLALHLTAILLSGSRMPLILILFGCFLTFLFIKKLRFVTTAGCIFFISIFGIIYNYDDKLANHYKSLFNEINVLNLFKINKQVTQNGVSEESIKIEIKENHEGLTLLDNSGYNRIYRTSLSMWWERPITGFGLKTFRVKCWEILEAKAHLVPSSGISRYACANHPHNHYLELLAETGIIGFTLMFAFFLVLFKEFIYYLKKYKQEENLIILLTFPIIISLFIEIWPIRSTGSFFTTWTASYFWFNAGVLLGLKKYFNLT